MMMLGKHQAAGRPMNLENSRARAFCACSSCGLGLFGLFFIPSIITLYFLGRRYDSLNYCLKGPLNLKQPISLAFQLLKQSENGNKDNSVALSMLLLMYTIDPGFEIL